MKSSAFLQSLFEEYDRSKIPRISRRHFKHGELTHVIRDLQSVYPGLFELKQVGTSAEGRSINLMKLGKGRTKIFLWSQMHGDESTATRAILDMLNIIGVHRTESYIETILEQTALLILPMVNPDGAERFQRRNAQGIDINRDALALQTPEAQTLWKVRNEYAPEFGFNLHDQDPRFAVGQTDRIAAIALLAPAIDEQESMNDVRLRAKHVAAALVGVLSQHIPGHLSRYDDSFDARAFGDRIQQSGTSTVLVESGGWLDDPEKEFLRKINAIALLAACHSIATGEYEKSDLRSYESLPENNEKVFDVLIRDAVLRVDRVTPPIKIDIGVNIDDQRDAARGERKRIAQVVDLGDLTAFRAFRTIDARKRTISLSPLTVGTTIPLESLETGKIFVD